MSFHNNKILSVSEITKLIEAQLTQDGILQNISVIGEITEFTRASSGHIYFTLSDKDGQSASNAILKCAWFKFAQRPLDFDIKKGVEIEVLGGISVYAQGGTYNFRVNQIKKQGAGNLLLRIQQIRTRLIQEGIIDPSRKRSLPYVPITLGIVTSTSTAALRDIMKQVLERYENVNLVIASAIVQGAEAPESLVSALREIQKPEYACDLVIIGRGGGSNEDLMAFNDETLCREIALCRIPVISAVGHQTDHPISDDVADVASATPTDAAKLAIPVRSELLRSLDVIGTRMLSAVTGKLQFYSEKLKRISERPVYLDPLTLLESRSRIIDDVDSRLQAVYGSIIEKQKQRLQATTDLNLLMEKVYHDKKIRYSVIAERLSAYSPLATLKRGFTITYRGNTVIRSSNEVVTGEKLDIQFHDGKKNVQVL